jgi:linoleoyl-CoA desaturase
MTLEKLNVVGFASSGKDSFHETIMARVNAYFKEKNISPYANGVMWVKTTVMLLMYFAPLVLIVTGVGSYNLFLFYGLWLLMAIGMIGIGTSVMHDAHHGTYSPKKWVNNTVGFILEIIGGFTINWKIQHNQLHHTYTNITGLDEDIDSIKLLRFSPRQPRYWFHRYQYIYAWGFYMLMTLFWMTAKDYIQVIRYQGHDLLRGHKLTLRQALLRITLYKFFYYAYIIALPTLFSGVAWYHVIFGFLIMHCVAGLFLSCIFQPAHIIEESSFQLPVEDEGKRTMEESWAVHEVKNTADFAPRNYVLTWFIGGLNYQIEHHLLTRICHVHYPRLAPIVKKTAEDFNIPYHVEPTFFRALAAHTRMLKKLGRE